MLAEIRGRSQITIPAEIIKKLGISEGDKFDITEKDGGIFLCPVIVYPKDKLLKKRDKIHLSILLLPFSLYYHFNTFF